MTLDNFTDDLIKFFAIQLEWLSQQPIQNALIIILSFCNLALFFYIIGRNLIISRRLESIELRHGKIIDRILDIRQDVDYFKEGVRRETGEFSKELEKLRPDGVHEDMDDVDE